MSRPLGRKRSHCDPPKAIHRLGKRYIVGADFLAVLEASRVELARLVTPRKPGRTRTLTKAAS